VKLKGKVEYVQGKKRPPKLYDSEVDCSTDSDSLFSPLEEEMENLSIKGTVWEQIQAQFAAASSSRAPPYAERSWAQSHWIENEQSFPALQAGPWVQPKKARVLQHAPKPEQGSSYGNAFQSLHPEPMDE
jgi:hypothetical protein